MRQLIELKHHFDDYACMWNGIEDLYIQKSGETLPPNFFFVLSAFGSFCYMKTDKAELKRMVALGDGRTKKMYAFLAPIVGFTYRHCEHRTFELALKQAKAEIDAGFPAVLGALDMYNLPYFPNLYHQEHIPFHYILMVGYDDDQDTILMYDCGREQLQSLSCRELRLAWDCSYPGLSKPNTVCTVRMNSTKDKYEIAKEALRQKSKLFLNPPTGFLGYKGFEKFIADLPKWKFELSPADYDKVFTNMVTFFATVPTVPNAIKGIDEPDDVAFGGGFDKMSRMLASMGMEYGNENWCKASACFGGGAAVIEKITGVIITYLTGKDDEMHRLPELFSEAADIMKRGFIILQEDENAQNT